MRRPICFFVTQQHVEGGRQKRSRSKLKADLQGERALGQHNLAHEPLTSPDLFPCTVIFARARQCGYVV